MQRTLRIDRSPLMRRHKQCSKYRVQKLVRLIFVATIWIGARTDCIAAEKVFYPEINAAFTVDVPNGWEARHEQGAVRIIAQQANAVFLLQHVDNVKDEETAKEALPDLANFQAKHFGLEDTKVMIPAAGAQMGDFKGMLTQCTGKDKEGNDIFWQVMIFSPKGDDYFLVSCLWSKDVGEKTAADRAALFKSLKAAPGQ
jgi:hypothetical protein